MATRDEIGRELLERIQEDHPELYETLLGAVPRGELPAELQTQPDKARAGWEAEQKQMKAELDNRLKNLGLTNLKGHQYLTQKYKIHDELRGRGLGQAYSPEAAPRSPEALRAAYEVEIKQAHPGSEQVHQIRAKYRAAGLEV